MYSLSSLLFWTSMISALSFASRLDRRDAAKTTSCNPIATFNAKFDNLPVGSSPATNFGGAGWDGWTVDSTQSSIGLKPKSGANVIRAAGQETSTIFASEDVLIEIVSFYFGCAAYYHGFEEDTLLPASCSIMVTTIPGTYLFEIETAGPFTSQGFNFSDPTALVPMTRVDLNVASTEFWFQIVGGLGSSVLYLDNVIIISQNATACT